MKKYRTTITQTVYVCESCGNEDTDKQFMTEHEPICKKFFGKRVRLTEHRFPQPRHNLETVGTCTHVAGVLVTVKWDNGYKERYHPQLDRLEIVEKEPVTK